MYPDAYRAAGDDHGPDEVRLGESWETGSVVLSWQSVQEGADNTEDGRNVVIHEFAHQIDQYDGDADGLPILKGRLSHGYWRMQENNGEQNRSRNRRYHRHPGGCHRQRR